MKERTGEISESNATDQPIMSTGTSHAGFDWDTDGSKMGAKKPKVGETVMGEKGIKR
ncbi:hypothetical protein [Neobacillus terrae]|uniref:hypothetical protein n=1 Tax=Neobacillus terrae TaxID=3034837 RepID=UPI00140B57A2|nr:hypothetical protein [Neobacillus terrae]NHM32522.1 hypothetical protein [Neobacillus terrae]